MYTARVSGRYVTVRVDRIYQRTEAFRGERETTVYDVTNLDTGRKITFRSAAKFRKEVKRDPNRDAAVDQVLTDLIKQQEAKALSNRPMSSEMVDKCKESIMREEFTLPGQPQPEEGQHSYMERMVREGEQSHPPTQVADNPAQSATVMDVGTVAPVSDTPTFRSNAAESPTFGSIAAKIAEQSARQTTGLTQQQRDILDAAQAIEAARGNGQRVMVIGAGAGTGKTFTLKQLEQVLQGNGQYTAFNSSLVAESKAKFTRAACNTTHSLAFRAVGKQFAHRLNGARVRSWEIAARLNINDFEVELPPSMQPPENEGKPPVTRTLKAAFLAGQLTVALRRFCQSADREIGAGHFMRFDGLDEKGSRTNSDKVKEYLLPFAKRAWADLSDPQGGTMPFNHDVYVKLWELGRDNDRPVIAADYILLDEAQDTAPVMLSILQQQEHALLILVGDDNQQIYEWRGAVNAMASFPGAPRKLLSQSFRFGQAVADVANAVLAGLEEPTDLVMRGLESIPTRVCKVAEPRCYLYRTNAGAIGRLMSAIEQGKRGHLIGGTQETITFCRAASDLQKGNTTTHPELGCFSKWAEVQEYSKEAEGADLRLMVKLIDEFGAEKIIKALDDMPPEDRADVVLSTAHRSKGREWKTVRLGQDFPTANKLTDADRRLVYVAVTRAQEELDISECPTFCGGWDRTGGGEDGGKAAQWIAGIPIAYTAPMPAPEQLAAYRAANAAPKPAYSGPISANGITHIPAPVNGPTANPATGNGTGNGEFTWANIDGQWLVRGPADQVGRRVTVTRKNGSKSQETLRSVTKKLGDLWFYANR